MKSRIALLLALLLACACALSAKAAQTVIKISVTNQFNKPVENAEVILDFLSTRQITKAGFKKKIHWEVHTNQAGLAHFPPIPEGTVQLQVNRQPYQTFGKKIDIEGEEQLVEIKLEPAQAQYSTHAPLKPADPPKDPPKE